MKKSLLALAIIFVVAVFFAAAGAVEKPQVVAKPLQQKIWIKTDAAVKIIGGENDNSQPVGSLTQRYRLQLVNASGQKAGATIEIEFDKKEGKILRANVVRVDKAVGGSIQIEPQVACNSPCKVVCTHIMDIRNNRDIYICWCCCRRDC